jgi:hypothetical protein
MAIQLLNEGWYEIIDAESPVKITFGRKQNEALVTYLIPNDELFAFIDDVLGYAKLINNSYVTRKIPASHSLFPWLYAYKIYDIKGVNINGKQDTAVIRNLTTLKNIDMSAPPYVGIYKYWKVTVQFLSRNYGVYTDEQLQPFHRPQLYYMPRYRYRRFNNIDELVVEESIENFTDRAEYCRYTNFSLSPKTELLTYGFSNFWMKYSIDEQIANFGKERPVVMDTGGANNIKICKTYVDWNWYFVPYELTVRNQIWTEAYSKVNLGGLINDVTVPGAEVVKYIFDSGTLLFDRVEVKKYEPYYPFETINIDPFSSVYDWYTEYNKNQYADVKFKMIYYQYPEGIFVIPNPNTFNVLNVKSFDSAHNTILSPSDMRYYYIENAPAKPNGANFVPNVAGSPIFYNYAFENLFNYREGD